MKPRSKDLFLTVFLLIITCVFLQACVSKNNWRNFENLMEPRYADTHIVHKAPRWKGSIKVVSYNIKYAKKIEQATKLLKSRDDLRDADIILLQELDSRGVIKIAEDLDYAYVYYPAVLHPMHEREFGNAVLSKWQIKEDRKVLLPKKRLHERRRIAVGTTILIHDMEIEVYSVHLGLFSGSKSRKKQAEEILKSGSSEADYWIIGGDFNTFSKLSRERVIQAFQDRNLLHASEDIGWTFRSWFVFNKKMVVDHIFTRGFRVVDSGKVLDRKASDHFPIWVRLEKIRNSPKTPKNAIF